MLYGKDEVLHGKYEILHRKDEVLWYFMDKMKNKTKVLRTPTRRTTTIFKLVGPCEILSHGQKFLVPRRGIEPGPPQCERLTTCKKTIFAFIKAWCSPNTPKNFLIG